MAETTDVDLYRRGCDTLVASWAEYARGATGAAVRRLPGVAAAIFPYEPGRTVYNNAVLAPGLDASTRLYVLDEVEIAYADAGVTRFAVWVHESDHAARTELDGRGYTVDTTTRAMGMDLDGVHPPRLDIELRPVDWSDYLRYEGLPPDFSRPPTTPRSTSSSPARAARSSPPRWHTTTGTTVGSST